MSTKKLRTVLRRTRRDRTRAGGGLVALLLLATACGASSSTGGVATSSPAAVESSEAWRRERPAPGPAKSFEYPPAQVAQLKNGIRLYLVPRKAGTVALSVSARAGGAACAPGESGLAALTLRLMTEATRQKPGLALAKAVEELGASLGYDTGRDASSVSLEVLPSDVEPALELLAEVITEPRFAPDDVARVKKQWLDSLVSERQEPARLSSLAGMRALLGTSAGAPVGGTLADIERLTREDFLKFHQRQYVSGNLAIIAVGDLTMERLKELADKSLGQLPPGAPPPLPPLELPAPPGQTTIWLIDRPGSVQSALFVGQPFPERSAPGYEARQVMNNLLGGLFTSRLNLNLREKHAYTYGVRSVSIATRRWGAFISMSSVKTENTADALEQLTAELQTLRQGSPNPITSDELERSKTDLIHQLGASLEHVRRVLSDTGELYVDDLPADYQQTYPARIRAVDQAAALAEAQRLEPQRLVVVIVGDAGQVRPLLEAKGLSAVAAPASYTD